jgi:hypothetical protein
VKKICSFMMEKPLGNEVAANGAEEDETVKAKDGGPLNKESGLMDPLVVGDSSDEDATVELTKIRSLGATRPLVVDTSTSSVENGGANGCDYDDDDDLGDPVLTSPRPKSAAARSREPKWTLTEHYFLLEDRIPLWRIQCTPLTSLCGNCFTSWAAKSCSDFPV